MRSVIYFSLGVAMSLLSVKLIFNDFGIFDIQLAVVLIVSYVYGILMFRTGFSFGKLVFGSLGILLVLILLSFVAKMDVAVFSVLIFVIFYVEAMRKKREDK
ncbi:hypothetical protein [Aquibacillus rhizosphaerae]|uniref:Uncharacterized protein n=1 Tax=Aquibacillus rhizosphaerae TaxID=3051431 RepID=A0ABT7L367_9BACI|nr:hypothetical protein [Aquibacillus sp. LR5S19]MDL4839839.1 hypothetical protein [Aquibacillus sp. LR5S19]